MTFQNWGKHRSYLHNSKPPKAFSRNYAEVSRNRWFIARIVTLEMGVCLYGIRGQLVVSITSRGLMRI